MKYNEGDVLTCRVSKSPGYKKGSQYTVFKHEKDGLCLVGDDGFRDPMRMLCSAFTKVGPSDPTIREV